MADRAPEPLPALAALDPAGPFADRHIGPRRHETQEMLAAVGHPTLESLVDACVPEGVRDRTPLDLPPAADESTVLRLLRERAEANEVHTSMIGLGYSGTVTPAVIQRTILENPAWYTAYTPYQPEISQGRLGVRRRRGHAAADPRRPAHPCRDARHRPARLRPRRRLAARSPRGRGG